MKYSLRKKYIIAGMTFIITFLFLLLFISLLLKEFLIVRWNQSGMEKISKYVIAEMKKQEWDAANADLDGIAFENNVSITVLDEELHILAATRSSETSRGSLGDWTRNSILKNEEIIKKNKSYFYSNLDYNQKATFSQIEYISDYGFILIRKSITGLNSSMYILETCYAIAALILLLCGIPAIVYFSGRMVKPVLQINHVTQKIAKLDFSEKLPVHSSDELGMLAGSVNQMSDQLKETLDTLQKDIEVRKALVRNMAHELKTPTAVIMGYAENMIRIYNRQPEKLEKYCNVISKECDRMNSLISQMLEFSSRDSGMEAETRTEFSICDLLENIRRDCVDEFPDQAGNLKIFNHTTGKVNGDFTAIHRALYNMIKNAFRYGRRNGLVRITAAETDRAVCFLVYNEGNPIPEEEQEKIWNVFYKVDSSRKREQESFGIGLSIVKQVAVSHGGNAGVTNKDDGVEFYFTIKK